MKAWSPADLTHRSAVPPLQFGEGRPSFSKSRSRAFAQSSNLFHALTFLRPYASLFWGSVAIAALYSLPLVLAYLRFGGLVHVFYPDEAYYTARVLDAHRGGTLGNPYLSGHEEAPKYLPELTERGLAAAPRVLRLSPLTVLAASRVVVPVLLFLALSGLARELGIEQPLAALSSATVAILPPVLTLIQPADTGQHGFLRLFRIVSPACHMLLLVLVLLAIVIAWKRATLFAGFGAGLAIAFLLFTPIYYAAFAAGGTALLALGERGPRRRALTVALLTAGILSVPFGIRQASLMGSPEVGQTLARFGLTIPGRGMEREVARRFVENLAVLATLVFFRKRIRGQAPFLFSFLLAAELLLVQNAVTNRQVQAFHWMHCLFLVWPLAGAAVWQAFEFRRGRFWLVAFAGILVPCAAIAQAIAFAHWDEHRAENPELYTLSFVMPRTIEWLNRSTAPGSVVVSSEDVMASLPLFTRNKVYWAYYAGQHVLSDSEVRQRLEDVAAWTQRGRAAFHFRADYGLLTSPECFRRTERDTVFRNGAEETCVVKVGPPKPLPALKS